MSVECDLTDDGAHDESCISAAQRIHLLDRIAYGPDAYTVGRIQALGLISAAAVPSPLPPLPQRRRPDPEQLARLARLSDITRRVGQELGLAPELLATRRDMERLVGGERDGGPLSGWRREAIGAELLKAL